MTKFASDTTSIGTWTPEQICLGFAGNKCFGQGRLFNAENINGALNYLDCRIDNLVKTGADITVNDESGFFELYDDTGTLDVDSFATQSGACFADIKARLTVLEGNAIQAFTILNDTITIEQVDGDLLAVTIEHPVVSSANNGDGTFSLLVDGSTVYTSPAITTSENPDGSMHQILADGVVVGTFTDSDTVSSDHPEYTFVKNAAGDLEIRQDGMLIATIADADTVSSPHPVLSFAPNATEGTDVMVDGNVIYVLPDTNVAISQTGPNEWTFVEGGVTVGVIDTIPDTDQALTPGAVTVQADGSIEVCLTTRWVTPPTGANVGDPVTAVDDACFTIPAAGKYQVCSETSDAPRPSDPNVDVLLHRGNVGTLGRPAAVETETPVVKGPDGKLYVTECKTYGFTGEHVEVDADITLDETHAGKMIVVTAANVIVSVPGSFTNNPNTPCDESKMPLWIKNASNGDIAVDQGGYISVPNSDNVVRGDSVYWPTSISCEPQYVGPRIQVAMTYVVNPGTTSPFEYATLNDAFEDIDTRQTAQARQTITFAADADIDGVYTDVRGDQIRVNGAGVVLTGDVQFNRSDLDLQNIDLVGSLEATNNTHLRLLNDIVLGNPAGSQFIIAATEHSSIVGGNNPAQITFRAGAVSTSTTAGAVHVTGISKISIEVDSDGLVTKKVANVARHSFLQFGAGTEILNAVATEPFAFDVSDNSTLVPGTGTFQSDAATAIFGSQYGGVIKFSESSTSPTNIDGTTGGQTGVFSSFGGDTYSRANAAIAFGGNITTQYIPALTGDDAENI